MITFKSLFASLALLQSFESLKNFLRIVNLPRMVLGPKDDFIRQNVIRIVLGVDIQVSQSYQLNLEFTLQTS